VAVLRTGRLVEVAGVTDLRRLHRSQVEVTFTGPAPDLTRVPGVEGVEAISPSRLRFTLTGAPAPALQALATMDVTALRVHEPTLEEIFLDYYTQAAR
jgi:ABC-2 type transport system ATP-binding protein